MSIQENVQVVKNFLAAMGGDRKGLLALSAEDIEWITPGEWSLAGTHRGQAGLADFLRKASKAVDTSISQPLKFVAQGGPGSGRQLRSGAYQSHEQDV